jgi:pimeloyl-ACP methyl ester carboxylesterase
MAQELHAMLAAGGVPAPYVLVGHSMGGTNVQLFAGMYPMQVAGMVLLDTSTTAPPFEQFPKAELEQFERNINQLEGLDIRTFQQGFADVERLRLKLGTKPLAIVIAGKFQPEPFLDPAQARQTFLKRQADQRALAHMSSNSVVVTAQDSPHHLPLEAPQVVIDAVNGVVRAARSGEAVSK